MRRATETDSERSEAVETDIPARLDALPFGRFHLLVIGALGITWILDGLEVTLAGALSGELKASSGLSMSDAQIGVAGSSYLCGAVVGAFFFGWLTDRLGRKKLFSITLAVYLAATAATGLSWDAWSFIAFRFLTGAGIGGEYAAINSAIQELIPARMRGWTDLLINGSFWVGAAMGAGGAIVLLNPNVIEPEYGWRLAFLIGTIIGLSILVMRHWVPESPRWLMTHGSIKEADAVVTDIEKRIAPGAHTDARKAPRVRLRVRDHTPLAEVARVLFKTYRSRTLVGLALMTAQAFFYNAIFFTYALVLGNFYGTSADQIGWYILPFAAGNVLGPILLGRLFDTIGRKVMIAITYGDIGLAARFDCISVQPEPPFRTNLDGRVDDRLFLCLGGRKFRLSHCQRNFSSRNARARYRVLLCGGYRRRRRHRPTPVGHADQHWIAGQRRHRLFHRGGADDRRRSGRSGLGHRRRAQATRRSQPAVVVCRFVTDSP